MGRYLPTVERFRTRTMGRGCPRWFLLPGERFPEPRLVIPRGEGTTTFSPSRKAPSTTPRAWWMANWGFSPRRCSLFSLRDGGGGLGATHQRAKGCGVPNICSPRKGCGTNQQCELPWTALRGIVARGPSMVVATETIRSWARLLVTEHGKSTWQRAPGGRGSRGQWLTQGAELSAPETRCVEMGRRRGFWWAEISGIWPSARLSLFLFLLYFLFFLLLFIWTLNLNSNAVVDLLFSIKYIIWTYQYWRKFICIFILFYVGFPIFPF
jgi:hypothetical protein